MDDLPALRLDVDGGAEGREQRTCPGPAGDDDDIAAEDRAVHRHRDLAGRRGLHAHRPGADRPAESPGRAQHAGDEQPAVDAGPPETDTPCRPSRSGANRGRISRLSSRSTSPIAGAVGRRSRSRASTASMAAASSATTNQPHRQIPDISDAEVAEPGDERRVVGGAAAYSS